MPVEITVKAILSDNDGTLCDSTPAVIVVFKAWCATQGLDAKTLLEDSHGRRITDVVRAFARVPKAGADMTDAEVYAEGRRLEDEIVSTAAELTQKGEQGIIKLPGVSKMLAKLREGGARWAIVTSATQAYATEALTISGVLPPLPPALISGDVCAHGKPHPEPYLNGLAAINALPPPPGVVATALLPSEVLVLEDAPAGIASGIGGSFLTLGVCTSQPEEVIRATPATYHVRNLERVEVVSANWEGITLRITTLEEEK